MQTSAAQQKVRLRVVDRLDRAALAIGFQAVSSYGGDTFLVDR